MVKRTEKMKDEIFLLLGSNLGNKSGNLRSAENLIEETGWITVEESSSLYESAAWGQTEQPAFLNQVLKISTDLAPEYLLKRLLEIEKELGRIRNGNKWGPRLIDIDILFIGNQIIESPVLQVPHPEIQNRRFTLEPLNEIIPEFVHPVLKKSVSELLDQCEDQLEVRVI